MAAWKKIGNGEYVRENGSVILRIVYCKMTRGKTSFWTVRMNGKRVDSALSLNSAKRKAEAAWRRKWHSV